MLDALAPDLLAHILLQALGRKEEAYGHGLSTPVLPIVLGSDPRGLSGLRLVCKAFRDALRALPLHTTLSTPSHVGSLAKLWRNWDGLAAVKLVLRDNSAARHLVDAASALPDRQRKMIVTAEIQQELTTADVSLMLHKLEGLQHVVCGMEGPRSASFNLNCLSHLERLDLHSVCIGDVELLEHIPKLHNLHTLRFNSVPMWEVKERCLSFNLLAQCPALRVLMLGHNVLLESLGTPQEAAESLERSALQELHCAWVYPDTPVWKVVGQHLLTSVDIINSVHFSRWFRCTVVGSHAQKVSGAFVLQRRCAMGCIKQKIAACKGGGLVLDGDLSMQLVVSPALQELVREADIPVELQHDRPFSDSLQAEWQRLNVPVLSVRFHPLREIAWGILENCAWPCQGLAAIHGVHRYYWDAPSSRHFAARFCNLRVISLSGEGCMVEALPKGCECVEMRCEGQKVWRPMGHAAGLGAYPQIKRLSLEGFRVTELPPSVAHLTLRRCFVDGLQPPADRQLRSLRLEDVAREYSGAPPAQPLYLLDWLEKALPQAAVEVSDAQLTLGTLSMQRYARRLSVEAPSSIVIKHCTLHTADGCLSKHSVADMTRYLGLHCSRRVAVNCLEAEKSCRIVRVGRCA